MFQSNILRAVFVLSFACLLLAMPGSASAQDPYFDFPLPDPPNVDGSIVADDEPLVFIGNYCANFGGVSLRDNPTQSFSVDVIGTPVAAYFMWSGRGPTSATPDTSIQLSGNAGVTQAVNANVTLDAHSPSNFSWFTQSYDAIQGGFPIIEEGTNTFTASGLDFNEPHGAGVIIFSEDPDNCPFQAIGLFFGDDVFYFGWPSPSGPESEVTCIDFPSPPEDVEVDIQMFVGGIADEFRANAIWFATGSGAQPTNIVGNTVIADYLKMPLRGLNGPEFDNYDTVIQDPAQNIIASPGDTWACIQIESPACAVVPAPGCTGVDPRFTDVPNVEKGISANWIDLAVRVPLFDISITPDGLNPVDTAHTFTVTVDASFGITNTESLVITPTVEPAPDSIVDTCDTPVLTAKTAMCTVTINSSITGTFTATAEAEIEFEGQTAYAVTNGVGDSSGPAVKVYFKDPTPSIDIEKATNGEDADVPIGPVIEVGEPVSWTYRIENTGDFDLADVTMVDDNGTPSDTADDYTCDIGFLAVGAVDSTTCSQSGVAVEGQYANEATVTGTPVENNEPTGAPDVQDQDPSHYFGSVPDIMIEKATNGEDADTPTGPMINVDDAVNWTYEVTNSGNITLTEVAVVDDKGVAVTCPKTTLGVDEKMVCTGTGTAVAGQYANIGSVTGKSPTGTTVNDEDPSHYFGADPAIDIEKATNGIDADEAPGPNIDVGDAVNWTYVVSNNGNVELTNVSVTDDKGVIVTCPKTTLAVDESMTCTGAGVATAGQYANLGTATGTAPTGKVVEDRDPSHYTNVPTGIEEEEPEVQDWPRIYIPFVLSR